MNCSACRTQTTDSVEKTCGHRLCPDCAPVPTCPACAREKYELFDAVEALLDQHFGCSRSKYPVIFSCEGSSHVDGCPAQHRAAVDSLLRDYTQALLLRIARMLVRGQAASEAIEALRLELVT